MNKYSVRLFGQWLNFYNDFSTAECSNCGHCYEISIDGAINRMLFEGFKKEYKFCPNCGAKMCGLKNGTSEKIIDLDFNNQLDKSCGNCKHWHEHIGQEYHLKTGDCDKIIKGTKFSDDNKTYEYDGYSFEDECYDDYFNCFEGVEK